MRLLLLAPLLLLACQPALSIGPEMVDFRLSDVNTASATSGQEVAPRDELGRVSAWYFGHSS